MGRPLNKKWFGNPTGPGSQINVEAFIPGGSGVVTAWIVNQKSNTTYTITDGTHTGRCKLQAAALTAAGQCRISVTPFDGVPNVTALGTISLAETETIDTVDVTITNGGSGYSVAPTVTIDGDGDVDPTATATLTDGVVTSVTVSGGSANHTSATITFSAPAVGGTVEYIRILNAHQVKTFEGNVYSWSKLAANAGGEANIDIDDMN